MTPLVDTHLVWFSPFWCHEPYQVRVLEVQSTNVINDDLDGALKDLYAAVRAFLDKAKEYFDPENTGRVLWQIPGCRRASNGLCV